MVVEACLTNEYALVNGSLLVSESNVMVGLLVASEKLVVSG